MNLEKKALRLFLYMYAMKDAIGGYVATLEHLPLNEEKSIEAFKASFNTACDCDSRRVLKHILETPLIDHLDKDDFDKAMITASSKSNSEVMCMLMSNDKVMKNLTFDIKLIYAISRIDNEKAFELIKCLIEKEKYKISEHGDDIFNIAKDSANESLIEYLFVNDLAPGEQLPKNRSYEIALSKQETIAPIFLKLVKKLNIEFSENELQYLKQNKASLYQLVEKNNLFNKLSDKYERRESDRRVKI